MRIDIVTLFPEIALAPLNESIIKRAQGAGIVEIHSHDLRSWARDKHRKTDDYLCGGGQGMLLKPEPLFAAVKDLRRETTLVILTTPQGRPFKQEDARRLTTCDHLLFLCGHYEGVDHRIIEELVDEEISIGDYVLSGGEVAAMVVIDAVARLLPGVVGDAASLEGESYGTGRLAYPQFTRPEEFREQRVPPVLLSGHHGRIDRWRRAQMLHRTRQRRPDLLPDECLSAEDWTLIREIPASEDEDSL